MCSTTGQYITFDEEVVYARSVMRIPDCQKWNMESVSKVNVFPWDQHQKRQPEVIFTEKVEGEQLVGEPAARAVRKLYIKQADVIAFGHTRGCARCEHDVRYGYGRTNKGHTDACRTRIMSELAKTEAGKQRIEATVGRMDKYLSEQVESNVREAATQGEMRDDGLRAAAPTTGFVPIET